MSHSPKSVLHVVRGMANAGVETWLMRALRRIDNRRVRMDFLVHTAQPCAYDAEIRDRQSRILRCPAPLHSAAYAWRIREILGRYGPFDVVHSHVHHFSGYLLRLAKLCGVPARIAHSHSNTAVADRYAGLARRSYLKLMRTWIGCDATKLVGASLPAGESLFGRDWIRDPRSLVLYCGLDLDQFPRGTERNIARAAARTEWKIAEHDFVIGHVGRFVTTKNHEFLVRIAAGAMRSNPCSWLLLVGDGPLRQRVAGLARDLGIDGRVIFTGVQQQVPQILNAMDVFVFPSIHEGLGVALLEAQAAGLPCVVSDSVPEEADVVRNSVYRLPLDCGRDRWVETVLAAAAVMRGEPSDSLAVLEKSEFHICRSLEALYSVYSA